MLVISRKKDESILIGDDVEVVVLSTADGKVKLGIKAPSSCNIVRNELIKEVEEENNSALSIDLKRLTCFSKED